MSSYLAAIVWEGLCMDGFLGLRDGLLKIHCAAAFLPHTIPSHPCSLSELRSLDPFLASLASYINVHQKGSLYNEMVVLP